MKKNVYVLFTLLACNAAVSQNNYLPSLASPGKIGINTSAAPTLFPLEVSGGGNAAIGIDFGDYIGLRNSAIPAANRRLFQTSWDATIGDFVLFFTPGSSGTQNSLEKMRLTNAGCLDIGGDPLPVGRLQVLHTTDLTTNQNDAQIITSFQSKVNGSNTLKSNLWVVRDKTYKTSNDWYTAKLHDGISIDGLFATPETDTKTWWERFPDQNVQSWGNGGTTHMMLYQGKLSLNNPSSNPAAQLDVKETGGTISILARAYHAGDYGYAIRANVRRDLTKAFVVNQEILGNVTSPANSQETFLVYGNGATQINTNYNDAFMVKDATAGSVTNFKIQKNGQTCIGTKGPDPAGIHNDALLSVYGKVIAKSFYVTTATNVWADYVFEQNYKLMSLCETEAFVKEFKHLPGVSSAKEVEANGNNIAETEIQLLKKLEEAYLHIMELNKRVEVLEKKNK